MSTEGGRTFQLGRQTDCLVGRKWGCLKTSRHQRGRFVAFGLNISLCTCFWIVELWRRDWCLAGCHLDYCVEILQACSEGLQAVSSSRRTLAALAVVALSFSFAFWWPQAPQLAWSKSAPFLCQSISSKQPYLSWVVRISPYAHLFIRLRFWPWSQAQQLQWTLQQVLALIHWGDFAQSLVYKHRIWHQLGQVFS